MELLIKNIAGIVLSYLIGSFPTAYLAGRLLKGIDIRAHGSGNVGATNAFRVLGKGPGSLVLFVDIVKGIIPCSLVADLLGTTSVWSRLLFGIGVVAGHNWTVFLRFKGGKGIAASLGVLIGLTLEIAVIRPVLLWALLIWLAVFLLSGYVSLASICAAASLPILMLVFGLSFEFVLLGIILCIFVVLRHRSNIKRILHGQESRVRFPFSKSR